MSSLFIGKKQTKEKHPAQNSKFLLEKIMSKCCAWLQGIYNRANKRYHERDCGYSLKKKKVRCKGFQDRDLGDIQELTDTIPEE